MIIDESRYMGEVFRKVSLKILNAADYYRFSDLYSVCLETIDH